jgi:predicted transposase/invertase (TIGR01784 family)
MPVALLTGVKPLLDPKLDLVFKLLFSRSGNESLVISLLTAVLRPAVPIISVKVLNPQLPGEAVDDKNLVLDVVAFMSDGRMADVEMQMRRHAGVRRRVLMYWARLFEEQLQRSQFYDELKPVVGIYLLGEPWLPGGRFHSIFRLQEVHDQTLFTDAIELHTVELSKLPTGDERLRDANLVRWVAFFNASNKRELETAVRGDPIMQEAKRQLEELSADPEVRHWAQRRALGQKLHHFVLAEERREGHEKGLEEGLAPLARLYERRLGRALAESEHAILRERLTTLGPDRLGDVVLDLSSEELGRWLADLAAE